MIRIGCSGWNYKHWRGPVYPPELPARSWFDHYATLFDTVEINNSFYQLPDRSTFAAWRERAPRRFLYAVKGSRYLTHLKRLREPEQPVSLVFDHVAELGDRLGPILFQLPPHFHRDLERLDHFLSVLPRTLGEIGARPSRRRLRHVIEFRHPSWYVDETLAVLRAHETTMCLHDKFGSAITEGVDGALMYVRFHGPGGRYFGRYDTDRLQAWAGRLYEHAQTGSDVFAYFNNDPGGMAVINAMEMKALVAQRGMG